MPPLRWNTLFLVIAFVLFLLAALVAGGMISMSSGGWLVPGGLASLTLAMLIP
jgi:hypothetical protein